MNIYEYIPAKNLKKISGALVILISAACGFFAFPAIFTEMPMRWLFQLSGVGCLVAVIFFASRYISKAVVYRLIETDEGGIDFTVTEVTNGGRTKVTVCRFDIANIEKVELFYAGNRDDETKKKAMVKRAKKDKRKLFNYSGDIKPPVVCCLLVEECGEKFFIKLTPDATIFGYFKKAAEALDNSQSE